MLTTRERYFSAVLLQTSCPSTSASFFDEISGMSPKIIYFSYLKKYFPDQIIQKQKSINFEKGSTALNSVFVLAETKTKGTIHGF